ncbi:MAG: hypothetical protein ABDH37_04140 [Candidatus Hydrothermales bacterium]
MILLLFTLPLLKGLTGVSYPVDFLDRFVTSAFTKPEEKFGFFYEIPTQMSFFSIVYRNFSFESDTRNYVSFSSGTYAEKVSFSLRTKIIFVNKTLDGIGVGSALLHAPNNFMSFGFYAEGIQNLRINTNYLTAQIGISLHQRGFAFNTEPVFTTDSLGIRLGATYLLNLSNFLFENLKFYAGLQAFKKRVFSFGISFKKSDMKFMVGLFGEKFYFGYVLDFKKRILIKEIVKIKEVPIYVEKKETPPEKEIVKKPLRKKEEEKKEEIPPLTEEELEFYYKKGIEFYKMELLEEAIRSWEVIVKSNPSYKDTKRLYEKAKERLEKLKKITE